jgi:hypothetical protein
LTGQSKRWLYALWLILIAGFALLHALHLTADFPNHSPWMSDWAKYTDEGWYGNAAVRAHLLGHWYMAGDFNPAVAAPLWPFLEWILFFFTGVSIEAARGLAVGLFFVNLLLSYLLLRGRGQLWVALLALTLMVTSPFLYCFGRLAILEPLLTTLTLAALNVAVRAHRLRRPALAAAAAGLLFAPMVLTKMTAVFFLPALLWALVLPMWRNRKLALRCLAAATAAAFLPLAAWMGLIWRYGLWRDFKYYFLVNKYPKPPELYWPVLSSWWSLHGLLWVDRILIPLAIVVVLTALLAWRGGWLRGLVRDPVFGASVLGIAGCVGLMAIQNHPQPRYFAPAAVFCFFLIAQGAGAMVARRTPLPEPKPRRRVSRFIGWTVVAASLVACLLNGAWTLSYAAHPEYTFVNAAEQLVRYIDAHPNGKRLLVATSGDELTLITHVPSICDDFGTEKLVPKLAKHQPGWWATWNDIDPGTLEDLHVHYSIEQVAVFRAYDHPDRNMLVLFKLHPLALGQARDPVRENLQLPLAGDKFEIPIQ